MTVVDADYTVPLHHADRLFIGGEWRSPASAAVIDVVDSATELTFLTVPEADGTDMERAVAAARTAFDTGPWPRLSHAERATYLRAFADGMRRRMDDFAGVWPRESGVVITRALPMVAKLPNVFDFYAGLADTYPFEEPMSPSSGGGYGLLVREPVGVVGAIIPWNAPLSLITYKIAPALIAGCTIVLKASPEAPAEAYIMAEIAEEIGLPAGVLNVLTADREVSELLVRDPRVDKISFTGSTAAGRRIASLLGERIGRYTLELGGKSAAVVLDDADIAQAAATLSGSECFLSGQVCSSLTRVVVTQRRHDELVEALSSLFSQVLVGDPMKETSEMGPLAMSRQLDRVESMVAKGLDEGATLATGGGRPAHLERGYYFEPTVFGNVSNSSSIAREEIFGPVISVIPVPDEGALVPVANDTIYGLNASVFTSDVGQAREVAGRLRSGTVGHNSFRTDFGMAFGGFKQSGIGREGGLEGLLPYLETKTMILTEEPPSQA